MLTKQQTKDRIRDKRKSWLKTMKMLLVWYQTRSGEVLFCPLCKSAVGYCSECVWMYFMGVDCAFYHKQFTGLKGVVVSNTRMGCAAYPEWTEMRIKQLKQWIKNVERWV